MTDAVARRLRVALILLALAFVPSAPVGAQAADDDFHLILALGAPPRWEGAGASARPLREVPGELLEWELTTTQARLTGRIDAGDYFGVDRPAQVLPEVDDRFPPHCRPDQGWPPGLDSWHFFTLTYESTVRDAVGCAHLANLTGTADDPSFVLSFPVNATSGTATLRLMRDMTPPGFGLGHVERVNHFGFYFETTTTEWAFADLRIRPAAGGEPVENPTTTFSRLQRFPVQGLDAATAHVFHVEFWDWSGNRARSGDLHVTTAPAPVHPAPKITSVTPAPNSTSARVSEIAILVTDPASTVVGANLFLDKQPIPPDLLQIQADRVVYAPAQRLAPGLHVVAAEVVNALGATAVMQWKFEIQESASPGAEIGLTLMAILVLVAGRRIRRRGGA